MVQHTIKFYNGNSYPVLGLGTWKSKPNEVTQAVKDAIDNGYRHIDCAPVYGNEKEVGQAIKIKIDEGVIKRDHLYVTSKLWCTKHRPDVVEDALKNTLKDLGLETLDLYLMHCPFAFKEGNEFFPTRPDGKFDCVDIDYLDTWRAMEKLYENGLVKNIGVSNFNSKQIERLLSNCKIKPVTNQVECHPRLTQEKLSEFCASKGITITAYSPFCSPDRVEKQPDHPNVLDNPKIKKLAAKYKKTTGQILIRYQIQRGHLVIPKSVTKSRIEENIKVFDFELSQDDMKHINSLNINKRISVVSGAKDDKYYPFNIEF